MLGDKDNYFLKYIIYVSEMSNAQCCLIKLMVANNDYF